MEHMKYLLVFLLLVFASGVRADISPDYKEIGLHPQVCYVEKGEEINSPWQKIALIFLVSKADLKLHSDYSLVAALWRKSFFSGKSKTVLNASSFEMKLKRVDSTDSGEPKLNGEVQRIPKELTKMVGISKVTLNFVSGTHYMMMDVSVGERVLHSAWECSQVNPL